MTNDKCQKTKGKSLNMNIYQLFVRTFGNKNTASGAATPKGGDTKYGSAIVAQKWRKRNERN